MYYLSKNILQLENTIDCFIFVSLSVSNYVNFAVQLILFTLLMMFVAVV